MSKESKTIRTNSPSEKETCLIVKSVNVLALRTQSTKNDKLDKFNSMTIKYPCSKINKRNSPRKFRQSTKR